MAEQDDSQMWEQHKDSERHHSWSQFSEGEKMTVCPSQRNVEQEVVIAVYTRYTRLQCSLQTMGAK